MTNAKLTKSEIKTARLRAQTCRELLTEETNSVARKELEMQLRIAEEKLGK